MKDKSVMETFVDPEPQLQEVVPDGDRRSVNEVYLNEGQHRMLTPPVENDDGVYTLFIGPGFFKDEETLH